MNSLPLSESMPSNGKGSLWRIRWIALETASRERCNRAATSVQPVQMSVQRSTCSDIALWWFSQYATRSLSINPGRSSSHSVKVRTGMRFFSRLPGLVILRPCGD